MAMLTDEMLLDSYHMAIQLNLERDFIALLLAEIRKRELDVNANALAVLH
ncbi:sporulation histidine kinase inhibitor Sda [Paenibacillus sp. JX-17]|uniref:Sporulation histidine kinase inhibitor Sda n=1 Tax=Paenibacillus lacisoli TaxID=3064525 RepID=A0ABT9CCT6_9BACL|nr:sporulation histidine kinase inhibitor Sda [Paenibacillus sp. JX-17]MDO7907051.1 sporulation histidine kinase inhibitor Sda [Paenibacillus sp. JX-17]